MEPKYERTGSIRVVDDGGNYYDVDCFTEIDNTDVALTNGKTRTSALRVNRQAAKQVDDSTYEIIATGKRLRRVSPKDAVKT